MIENCQFLTFKVSFLRQKISESFSIFFFIEEYKFRGTFFVIDIFWKLQFLKHFVYQNHAYFSIAWFRVDDDLPKKIIYGKVLFFTQLGYHLMCKLLKKILHVIYCVMPIIMILAVLFISGTIISVPCCLIISIFFSALLFKCQWITFKCVPFLITSSPWQILLETHSQVV